MSASATDELIGVLTELRCLFPNWRLGQLVANLVLAAGCDGDGGIWEVEDEQLLAAARRLIQRNGARKDTQAEQAAAADWRP